MFESLSDRLTETFGRLSRKGRLTEQDVHEELINVLGSEREPLRAPDRPPQIVMLVGLQGSGKTTHAAKLAVHLRKEGRNPLLVAADVYRPAAINQLQAL